jgi:dynein light chain Tctex-type 1
MSFNLDEIKLIIKEILHEKIGEREFLYDHVRQWNIDILTEILHRLKQIQEKYNHQQMKYVVTVLIGEKTKEINFGLHTALSCLWDGTTDGCVTVKWENKNIFSIISIFGLAV